MAAGSVFACPGGRCEDGEQMEQTIETLSIRVDKLEKDTADLAERANAAAITQAAINEKLNSVLVTLGELKAGLAALQQVPSKRWEGLVGALIASFVAAFVGIGITLLLR